MKRLLIIICMLGLVSTAVAQEAPQDDKPVLSLSLNKKQFESIKSGLKVVADATVALYLVSKPLAVTCSFVRYANVNLPEYLLNLSIDPDYKEMRAGIAPGFFRLALGGYMFWKTYKDAKKALIEHQTEAKK